MIISSCDWRCKLPNFRLFSSWRSRPQSWGERPVIGLYSFLGHFGLLLGHWYLSAVRPWFDVVLPKSCAESLLNEVGMTCSLGFQAVRYAALRIIIMKSSQNCDWNILVFVRVYNKWLRNWGQRWLFKGNFVSKIVGLQFKRKTVTIAAQPWT